MSYNYGMPEALTAAQMQFLMNAGLINESTRRGIDDNGRNNFVQYVRNAAGNDKIPFLNAANGSNQTRLLNPNGVNAYALEMLQLATPATPTITNVGTVGSTANAYKVVAINGAGLTLGSTPASAAGSTATANATLTSAHYNVVTFAKVTGAVSYDIYRTTAAGTPSTTGKIGSVTATHDNSTGTQTATYAFSDTGLAGDTTTAPSANTTGAVVLPVLAGGFSVSALTTPAGVTATPGGTVGSTTITYKIVARGRVGTTAASSAGTTTTGNATLSASNYVTVAWDAVPGAVSYDVYRTAAGGTPSTTGLVANVAAGTTTYRDIGVAGDTTTAPTVNTTGDVTAARVDVTSALTSYQAMNYVTAAGSNNAITVTLTDSAGNNVTLAAGLLLNVKLANTLQAGANTLALNSGSAKSIKKATNPATDLGTAFAVGGIIQLLYDGTQFLALSQ